MCNILNFGKKARSNNRRSTRMIESILWDADKGRICNYCGINMDIPWLDILKFFHEDCWKQYRKDGKLYPMPKYA
jgi:hypothetical protein